MDPITEYTHSTEGLLTHVGSADCFIALPHPALQCGIVAAWWQSQVEGGTATGQTSRSSTGCQRCD